MKRNLFICVFCLLLSSSLLNTLRGNPQLSAQMPVFDFGTIREGVNATVSFIITNTSSKKIKINEIRTFASCVLSRPLESKELEPGDSLQLEYVFESLGYGGADIDKPIEILYNDKKHSPLVLRVRGKVLPLESHQAPVGEVVYNFSVVIDLRSPERFHQEHLLGAINVPLEKLEEWVSQIGPNLSEDIVVYLYSEEGREADRAAFSLRKKGFSQFISLVGGLKEWKNQQGNRLLVSGKF
ncbi:MAG: rhodanese-like domain-containing protein [Candidatus Aminicenantales bacterium]